MIFNEIDAKNKNANFELPRNQDTTQQLLTKYNFLYSIANPLSQEPQVKLLNTLNDNQNQCMGLITSVIIEE